LVSGFSVSKSTTHVDEIEHSIHVEKHLLEGIHYQQGSFKAPDASTLRLGNEYYMARGVASGLLASLLELPNNFRPKDMALNPCCVTSSVKNCKFLLQKPIAIATEKIQASSSLGIYLRLACINMTRDPDSFYCQTTVDLLRLIAAG
jgi:hypothetical protein